jgi:hypothetical protein
MNTCSDYLTCSACPLGKYHTCTRLEHFDIVLHKLNLGDYGERYRKYSVEKLHKFVEEAKIRCKVFNSKTKKLERDQISSTL